MKLVLMVFGLMMVLTFGAITTIDSYTASAGSIGAAGDDDDVNECRDDADNDDPGVDEPDNPDDEENQEETDGGEIGDTEESPYDPFVEWDDDCQKGPEPTGVLGETITPGPTCIPFGGNGVSAEDVDLCLCPNQDIESAGEDPCICDVGPTGGSNPGGPSGPTGPTGPTGPDDCACFVVAQPCCTVVRGGDVYAEGFCYCDPEGTNCCAVTNNTCLCYNFPEFGDLCGCPIYNGDDDVNAELLCCLSAGGGDVGEEALCCFAAGAGVVAQIECFQGADANCDGAVGSSDVLASLTGAGGGEAAAEGCASGGDADCSGAVDVLDTLAILKILAGISEPTAC